jgi:CPA2 family monovalent cation:H+ antiporter-2
MEGHGTDLTAIALVTTVAVLCGLALTRLKQPAIVGYILAGIALGPTGLKLVETSENVMVLAELGVILLLFLIGMELSVKAFTTVLRVAIACALLQILLSLAVTFAFAAIAGWSTGQALVFGFIVALSSTAVAIKMLDDIGELRTATGRVTVGVLIAQDIAVVPMIVLVGNLGGEGLNWSVVQKIFIAVGTLALILSFLARRQRLVLPTHAWLRGKADLIPLAALAFCFTAATLTGVLGLSAAYGAFLAGLVIGNSTDRKATIHATHPIQSVLLVVFFLSIGLLIDLRFIADNLATVVAFVTAALAIKTAINVGALRLLGEPWERAFPAGVVMSQIGEFSFVVAAAGLAAGAVDAEGHRLAIAVIALSLLLSPLWLVTLRRFHAIAEDGVTSLREALGRTFAGELGAVGRGMGVFERLGAALALWLGLSRRPRPLLLLAPPRPPAPANEATGGPGQPAPVSRRRA